MTEIRSVASAQGNETGDSNTRLPFLKMKKLQGKQIYQLIRDIYDYYDGMTLG